MARVLTQREIAATVIKGAICLHCGSRVKSKHKSCRGCGQPNKHFTEEPDMNKKKAAKKARKAAVRSAYGLATNGTYTGLNKGAAMNALWQAELSSPDPQRRISAAEFLAR